MDAIEEKESGGVLKGLWDFLKIFEDMEKKGESRRSVSGGLEGPGYSRIDYDYSVKLGIRKEDVPRHSRRGFRSRRRPGRRVRSSKSVLKQRKPLVDVFDKSDHVMVVAELPDVKEDDITFEVVGNILKIEAKTLEGRFERNIEVPEDSEVGRIVEASFKNGVLEIMLSKRGGDSNG